MAWMIPFSSIIRLSHITHTSNPILKNVLIAVACFPYSALQWVIVEMVIR